MAQFTFEAVEELARSIRQGQQFQVGEEIGGLLFGRGDNLTVTRAQLVPNTATDRYREWSAGPEALSSTLRSHEQMGFEALGSWHTHPFGTTNLSRADAQLNHALPPLLLLVAAPLEVDRGRWEWRVHHSGRGDSPLDLSILPPRHIRL